MNKTILYLLLVIAIAGGIIWSISNKAKLFPLKPSTQATFSCDGNKSIDVAFYEGEIINVEPGEPPIPTGSVKLKLSDGRSLELPQTISASGARYANSDESFIFWNKGNTALVLENNIEKSYTNCITKSQD